MSSLKLNVIETGEIEYQKGYDLQMELVKKRIEGEIPNSLLIVNHSPVVTVGCRGNEGDILISPALLKKDGIEIVNVDRGGAVTYHGPGQMIAYLIMHLSKHGINLHELIYKYEESIIRTLASFDISAKRKEEYTGVWVEDQKICAIGIGVRRWVTYHGLALNININLDHYKYIIPCGITQFSVTSMEKILGHPVEEAGVRRLFIDKFCKMFNMEATKIP